MCCRRRVGALCAGTYVIKLSLHPPDEFDDPRHAGYLMFDVVPGGEPHMDPAYVASSVRLAREAEATLTHALAARRRHYDQQRGSDVDSNSERNATSESPRAANAPASGSTSSGHQSADDELAPLNVIVVCGTTAYDGMKAFLLDYFGGLRRYNIRPMFLDLTCAQPDFDSAALPESQWHHGANGFMPTEGNATSSSTTSDATREDSVVETPVLAALRAAGLRLRRLYMRCPTELCGSRDAFHAFASANGPLFQSTSLEQLSPEWRTFVQPLVEAFAGADVVMHGWETAGETATTAASDAAGSLDRQAVAHYALQLATLVNPGLLRVVDLGTCQYQCLYYYYGPGTRSRKEAQRVRCVSVSAGCNGWGWAVRVDDEVLV